jgi:DNA-binding GntR family transcriptional regulator
MSNQVDRSSFPSRAAYALVGPQPRRRGTMAHEATVTLRELIVQGAIPPGAPLRLEEIARSLGMSISPIREAVRELEALGLAEHVPYKGAHVTMLNRTELRDVYEIRLALESLAARRAAETLTDQAASLLTEALDTLAAAYPSDDRARIVHGNTAFHTALANASGSSWIVRLVRPTLETSERFGAALIHSDGADGIYAIEAEGHAEIVAAVKARDPDAAEDALRRHLDIFETLFEQGH